MFEEHDHCRQVSGWRHLPAAGGIVREVRYRYVDDLPSSHLVAVARGPAGTVVVMNRDAGVHPGSPEVAQALDALALKDAARGAAAEYNR